MNSLTQCLAAVSLVATLGIVAPHTFGGSASADISTHNPNNFTTRVSCDLDRNGSYETTYDVITTPNSIMYQDRNSTLVLQERVTLDVLGSDFTINDNDPATGDHDPTGTAVTFHDATADWWFTPQTYSVGHHDKPKAEPKGWKTVLCLNPTTYLYAPYPSDVALNDEFGLAFVQNTETDSTPGYCPDDSPVGREQLPECVTYVETDMFLLEVTLSQTGKGKAKAAHHHAHQHHGKHRH